jgi:hypothetical protein
MSEVVGICPICEREMLKGNSIDKHHFTPKCRGGKASEYLHKICHRKIHSIWTEKELEKEFNDPNKVCTHPEMEKFIAWVQKKDPEFMDKNEQHNRKKR